MSNIFDTPRNAGTLFLGGTKISGADVRDQNGKIGLEDICMLLTIV